MKGPSEYWSQLSPWQQSALIGTGVAGGLSSSYVGPLSTCCCLGVVVGAIIAVQQYSSRGSAPVSSGEGALLGLAAGIGGAIFASLVEFAMRIFGIGVGGAVEQVLRRLPESVEGARNMSEWQGRWEVLWFVGEMFVEMVLFAVLGAIGGAVGAAAMGTKSPGINERTVRPASQGEDDEDEAASNREGSV